MHLTPLKTPVSFQYDSQTITWGDLKKWVLFAGPDILEDEGMLLEVATEMKTLCEEKGVQYILKCSFDKANRQSLSSYRGPGMEKAFESFARVKSKVGVPLLTDVHETAQVNQVAEIADVLQIPAFLCRQTDLVVAAAKTGKVLHLKKGQFMAPEDMEAIANKAIDSGNNKVLLCDRGTTFGYQRLINDITGLSTMRSFGLPVIMDMTHSTQRPGAAGGKSGGDRTLAPIIARAAMAAGIDGIFCETHPNPDKALCDGPTSMHLKDMGPLIDDLNYLWKLHAH